MSRKQYVETADFKIFIIFHSLTNAFFVHFTKRKILDRVFSTHWNLENTYTKDLFLKYRDTIYAPEIYLLEEVTTTLSEANTRKILWIKYFLAQQYTCLNDVYDIDAANDLQEENKKAYASIATLSVKEVLSDKNLRCLNYDILRTKASSNEDTKERKQVKFFCSMDEFERINELAAFHNKTRSAYLREVALNGFVLNIDYESIKECTKQVTLARQSLNMILRVLVSSNEVYPGDIETIINIQNQIDDALHSLNAAFQREQNNRYKKIRQMINKIIKGISK